MTEYSVIFVKKIYLRNILLLSYNPQHIQMAYTIPRLTENNFEAKTKLKLNWLGFFVKMAEYCHFLYANRWSD